MHKSIKVINKRIKGGIFRLFLHGGMKTMKGKKVVYNNETYNVLHDYRNGQIEIKKENSSSLYDVKFIKKEEVLIINN